MYLPYIMICVVYGLRAILRHLFPKSMKLRQFVVFLLAMYSLILLAGCATGYARWVAFLRNAATAQAEVIFSGICTDDIFASGRYKRAYKRILTVPAKSYNPQTQPFTDDLGNGSLLYQIQTATAGASVANTVDNVLSSLNTTNAQLRLSNTSAQAIVATNSDVALRSGAGALAIAQQTNSQQQTQTPNGFPCIGYRFQNETTDEWVYAQQDAKGQIGQRVTVRYYPNYPEDNWLEASIPSIMKSSISHAWLLAGVLIEALFSGYWLGIRKKRNIT